MFKTVVGLGDSVAFGIGDDGDNFSGPGWLGRSAHALRVPKHLNLSFPGARSKDLARVQIPAAECLRPDLALISIGGNDMLRSRFDPPTFARDIRESINRLRRVGTKVFLIEIPDPRRSTVYPSIVGKAFHQRASTINSALRWAAGEEGATVIDLWSVDSIYERDFWHVDRIHPSPRGYQFLTDRTVELLGGRPCAGIPSISAKQPNRWWWLLANASPWVLKRSFDLSPGLSILIAKGLCGGRSSKNSFVAPPSGLEPETLRLTVECSAN